LNFGVSASLQLGVPFDITAGRDENRDGLANDRLPGMTRNDGRDPNYASVDVR